MNTTKPSCIRHTVPVHRKPATWKFLPFLFMCVVVASVVHAQTPTPPPPPPKAQPEQLDQLLAPIALYPDALIAIMLPAATVPFDIVLAARYVRANGDPAGIPNQPWDASVKALAHYPDVLKWMDENVEWTRAVGDAFRDQQMDVLASIQQLRAKARAAGNLVSTPEQEVIIEGGYIRIVPAHVDVIYVPYYDPDVIYYPRPYGYVGPYWTFSIGWVVGPWLIYDCDWHYRRLWVRDWHPGWTYRRGWRSPWFYDHPRPRYEHHWHERDIPRPAPHPSTPQVPKRGPAGGPHSGDIVDPAPKQQTTIKGWSTPERAPSAPVVLPKERKGSAFGGYDRGSDARDASTRGSVSRQAPVIVPPKQAAPVRSVPAQRAAPEHRAAPERRAAPVERSAPAQRAAPPSAPPQRSAPRDDKQPKR